MAGKGSPVERGYMVLERVNVATGTALAEGETVRKAWVERNVFKASNRERAIEAFLEGKTGEGQTFEAIPESDWNPVTVTVEKVEPKRTFKYAKPQRTRPKKPKEVAAA